MKLKKRKNKFQFKRKLVVLSTLILLMVFGVGYSFLSENLGIKGNINLKTRTASSVAKFVKGTEFNKKIKEISNSEDINYSIKAIKRSLSIPDKYKTDEYKISDESSIEPILIWYDDQTGTIFYYSQAKTLFLNEDSSNMFSGLYNLETIETTDLDFSEVKDVSYMFSHTGYNTEVLNLDLNNWNTSKIEDMSYMFEYTGNKSREINIDLSTWNTTEVKNMTNMFDSCGTESEIYSLKLDNWDISKVENMSHMFNNSGVNAKTIYLGIDKWNTTNVKNMSYMFNDFGVSLDNFVLDISNWNMSNVEDITNIFTNTGNNSIEWNITIPKTNGNELLNTTDTIYGKDESIKFVLEEKEFTIKDS